MRNFNLPALKSGAGLRHEHFEYIMENRPAFRWFEIITENFLGKGGWATECLREISRHYTIIPHGVSLSIGSTDPLDREYLQQLKDFADELDCPWLSDHLCFTMVDHTNLNDLIPLPFTSEAVDHVVERIRVIQDILQRPFLIENVTRYITVSDREMSEVEFISTILEKADCGLLLDVTNVHLNAMFHEFDAWDFIRELPHERVGQIHLAGWIPREGGKIIDSHDARVPDEVWDLFRHTISLTGETSALVEWDSELPSVEELMAETVKSDRIMLEVCGESERVA